MEPRVLKIMNLEITDDSNGCLQDIHWYGGDFGYFPTYSIGAFIAAQLAAKIRNDISNYDALLESGNLKDITKWLKSNIHSRGSIYKINPLLELATGETLNLKYFENHITDRYINNLV